MPAGGATVSGNLARVQEGIERAADGRDVTLISVTKYAQPAWVHSLLQAGATDLGENLLPNAVERFRLFAEAQIPFRRHLIGPQQSRKARLITEACDMFQAVDRFKIAQLLDSELAAGAQRLDVLLEVNIDAEPKKSGWMAAEIEQAALHLQAECPHLALRGLMAIPQARQAGESPRAREHRTRASFARMREQFDRIAALLPRTAQWDTLSMGMSQDFTWAIAEGSTMVRIGSALFAGLEG